MFPFLISKILITMPRHNIQIYLSWQKIVLLSGMLPQVVKLYFHGHIIFKVFLNHHWTCFIVEGFLTCSAVFTYFTYFYLFNTMCIEWWLNHIHQGRNTQISSLKTVWWLFFLQEIFWRNIFGLAYPDWGYITTFIFEEKDYLKLFKMFLADI